MVHVESLDLSSPWAYVIVTALALIDGVVPLVPTRTAMIGLGVACAAGDTRAYPLAVVATVAAFVGDNVSYALGAHWWSRIRPIVFRGERSRRAWVWVEGQLRQRGLTLVVLSRVIPGGPTPITLTAGLMKLPIRGFRVAAAASALLWTAYALATGAFGELAVGDNLLFALLVGVSIAALVNLALRIGVRRAQRDVSDCAASCEFVDADALQHRPADQAWISTVPSRAGKQGGLDAGPRTRVATQFARLIGSAHCRRWRSRESWGGRTER
jgi:membrane protein DedA with SNARE-associated domain